MRSKSMELMKKIKDYVEDYMITNPGAKPTTRDVAAALSISSASASRYLVAMSQKGLLEYDRGVIGTEKTEKITPGFRNIGIAGSIPFGTPEEREAVVEEYIPLPMMLLDGEKNDYFILRASGTSMTDAGIDSGDLVVIKQCEEAHNGQIVAALVDGNESTLKRYIAENDKMPYLWAENNAWPDEARKIKANQFKIQGVAIKIIKDVVGPSHLSPTHWIHGFSWAQRVGMGR